MSTYPGEDPQGPEGQRPSSDPTGATPGTEPTAPYPQTPHPGGPVFDPTSSQPLPEHQQSPYGAPAQTPYGQTPYGQAPYGGAPAGYPPAGGPPHVPYSPAVRDHPQATTALVLGIVALVGGFAFCGLPLVASPFAWALGRNAIKEIEASQGQLGGEGQARAGMIMGIIGTVLAVLAIIAIVIFIVVIAVSDTSGSTSTV